MVALKPAYTSNAVPVRGHHFQANSNEKLNQARRSMKTDSMINSGAALNNYLDSTQRDLDIEINNESNSVVVKVVEAKTGRIIRQIPSEDQLQLTNNMDKMLGLLFDDKV